MFFQQTVADDDGVDRGGCADTLGGNLSIIRTRGSPIIRVTWKPYCVGESIRACGVFNVESHVEYIFSDCIKYVRMKRLDSVHGKSVRFALV